jgi:hypothetical protein
MRVSRIASAGAILITLLSTSAFAAKKYKVKVDSSPQQAAVYVENKAAGIAGYTPAELKLEKGDHKLILELPGYKPMETTVTVKPRAGQEFKYVLERQARPATLDVRASDDSANGATLNIDGAAVGPLPITKDVPSGRHEVVVLREGFTPYREWVDVGEGERRTMVVTLAKKAPDQGTLIVTADIEGAEVWVDSQKKDNAPTVIQLPVGPHVVEVKKEGIAPWRQEVTITAGQQSKVAAGLAAAAGGSLRILSSTAGAEVYLDGEMKGNAPQTITGVKPGTHVVEVRAKDRAPATQEVKVSPGEERVLKLDPGPVQKATATVKIASAVPDAEVFIDGGSQGKAPVTRQVEPGRHIIVVTKNGFAEYKRDVDLQAGQEMSLTADLKNAGGVTIITTPSGAQVVLDGVLVGPGPAKLPDVQAGDHVLEVRAAGYIDYRQTIRIEGGKTQALPIDLKKIASGPSGAQILSEQRGQVGIGGRAVRRGSLTADISAGYPYFIDFRATTGAWGTPGAMLALDAGIEVRTFFQFTDIAAHTKFQFVGYDPFYMAIFGAFGGGGGPNGRNTFFGQVGLGATISFNNFISFSARTWFDFWTDRFCPVVGDRELTPRTDCMTLHTTPWVRPDNTTFDPMTDRDAGARWYIGAWLDIALLQHVSIFGGIWGAPFQTERLMFLSPFNDVFPEERGAGDLKTYGQIGMTVKY